MAPSTPLITIITITYNAAGCLRPTLESLASQTYGEFEHLLIDGASTDNTLQIARELSTPGMRILSEKDDGLYDAMNKGLSMARGKYVLFLNAGDAFHSNATLARYAEEAEAGRDIIYGDTVIVDSERRVKGPRHLTAPRLLTYKSYAKGMLVCHQAFMVKRELAPKYDMQYRFSADYDWSLECIRRSRPGNCRNLNEVTIDYLSDGLTDKNHRASLMERFRIMRRHYGLMPTIGRHVWFLLRAAGRAVTRKLGGQQQ